MKITKAQKLILFSLGKFYRQLNQPLQESPVILRTSKVAFIELLLLSKIVTKQRRALYKNLQTLESKKFIEYDNKMVKFTSIGLQKLQLIEKEIKQFNDVIHYFSNAERPKRKLQTIING